MLTGELRSKVDGVWNAFWAGGIANPLEVFEQITYLLFMRGLDDAQTLAENKALQTGRPIERRISPQEKDGIGRDGGVADEEMRWSRLKNRDPATMFEMTAAGPKDVICDPACAKREAGHSANLALYEDEHAKINLPDIAARWTQRDDIERARAARILPSRPTSVS